MALVFSMQGIGLLLGVVVSIIVLQAFKPQIESGSIPALDRSWRIILVEFFFVFFNKII